MSMSLMTAGWNDSGRSIVNPTELLVYLALADFADEDHGMCWPLISTLAGKARTSERNVSRILSKFEQRHIVRRELRYKQSTMYQLFDPSTWLPEVSGDNLSSQNLDRPDVPIGPISEVTDSGLSGDTAMACRTTNESPTTSVVANAGTARTRWHPAAAGYDLVKNTVRHVDIDITIARYIARCVERGKDPTTGEWVRWTMDDEQRLINEIAERERDALHGATDDCGVPLAQRKAAPPTEPIGPVVDYARCATDPAYLASVKTGANA